MPPWAWLRVFGTILLVALAAGAPREAAARYAAIVVDYGTGRTLIAEAEDTPTYPASLTKMMTAYMAFDALRAGKLKLSTALPVSRRAASRPPSRLGLVEGRTITVENALLAILTKSANDAAVVLAEAISGSEDAFAEAMTKRAMGLGLRRTVFKNASGLPDSGQVTTARDMAVLATRLIRDHPSRYAYFSRRSFEYAGRRHMNHNRLLARYPGVDGLKTGYIGAAGYNLVASSKRNGRRVIAVVLGGRSARLRDRQMMALLDEGFASLGIARALPSEMRRLAARERERAGRLTVAELPAALLDLPQDTSATPQRRPEVAVAAADRTADAVERAGRRRAPLPALRMAAVPAPDDDVEDTARSMLVASLDEGDYQAGDEDVLDPGLEREAVDANETAGSDEPLAAVPAAPSPALADTSEAPAASDGEPDVAASSIDRLVPSTEPGLDPAPARVGGKPVPTLRAAALARVGALARARADVSASILAAASTLVEPSEAPQIRPHGAASGESGGMGTEDRPAATGASGVQVAQPAVDIASPTAPLPRRKPQEGLTLADAVGRQWAVQVGAFSDRRTARSTAITAGRRLPDAIDWSEVDVTPARSGSRSLYQARLVGMDRDDAERACRALRKVRHACIVIRRNTA